MDAIKGSNISNTTGSDTHSSVKLAQPHPAVAPTPTAQPSPSGGAGQPARARVGFVNSDTNAQLLVNNARILSAMTDNQAFATPTPSLATLTAAHEAYAAAVSAGQDSRIGRAVRRKQRGLLAGLLRQLAHYVDDTSAGDMAVLLSSGFIAQRSRSPVGILPIPLEVRLVRGKLSGQAIARCRRIVQASAYHWRLAPAATPGVWSPAVTTFAAHNVFEGLVPLTLYAMQVCAVGTAGAGDWSTTASVLVL